MGQAHGYLRHVDDSRPARAEYSSLSREEDDEDLDDDSLESSSCTEEPVGCFAPLVHKEPPKQGPEQVLEPLSRLPALAKPKSINSLATHFAEKLKMPVPLGLTAGHAVLIAIKVAWVRWIFFATYAIVIWGVSECTETGYAKYPWFVWSAWLPVQVLLISAEIYAFRWIAIPKIQVLKEFKVLGRRVSFYTWGIFNTGLSFLGCANVAGDSSFLGTLLRTLDCPDTYPWNDMWVSLWHQSLLGRVGLDRLVPSLSVAAFIIFFTSFAQIIYAVMECTPTYEAYKKGITYDVGWHEVTSQDNLTKEYKFEGRYDTFLTEGQNHGSALMSLAEANSMPLVLFDDLGYALAKAKLQFQLKVKNYHKLCMEHISSQVRRGVLHAFLGGALDDGLKVNLQATLLAMRFAQTPNARHHIFEYFGQSLLSLGLSQMSLMLKVYHALTIIRQGYTWCATLERVSDEAPDQDEFHTALRAVRCWIRFLVAMTIVCISICLYATIKLTMMFYCGEALWNVTGCAVIN